MEVITKLNNLKQEYIIITQTQTLYNDMNHNHNHLKQSKLQGTPKKPNSPLKNKQSINQNAESQKYLQWSHFHTKTSKTSTIIKKYSARLVSKNPLKQTYLVLVNSICEP